MLVQSLQLTDAISRHSRLDRASVAMHRTSARWFERAFSRNDSVELQFTILAVWLGFVFLLGGGSRGDIQSLVILRPIAALVLAYGLATLTSAKLRANGAILGIATALVALVVMQLAPLPPSIWHDLPGRTLVAEMDQLNDLDPIWRPLTMTPAATRNAAWSLLVPMSVLVLAVQLERRQLIGLVPVMLVIGSVSGLLGVLQLAADSEALLYFYRVTHYGLAVGLFANRNHQALLLAAMVPMVVAWISLYRPGRGLPGQWRVWAGRVIVLMFLAILLPLVLITGSRLGMVAAAVALLGSPLLFVGLRSGAQHVSSPITDWRVLLPLAGAIAALIVLTAWLGRAIAFDRLLGTDPNAEMRIRIIPTVLAMIRDFWPWGSGFGSFSAVYQIYEPDMLLNPTYMNQVHNDWLDVPLSGGLPAVILAVLAMLGLLVAAWRRASARRSGDESALMARLGVLVLALLGLGSISDYPLRVPSLACLAVIAVVWITAPPPASVKSDRHD